MKGSVDKVAMRYLICTIGDKGFIHTLDTDHDLARAKEKADVYRGYKHQVKVLERTRQGYRVAYVVK